jgi:hypothetical protein
LIVESLLSIFPAGYLNSLKDDEDAIDIVFYEG